jgi:Ca2+-binding EF-hand superfamily protein
VQANLDEPSLQKGLQHLVGEFQETLSPQSMPMWACCSVRSSKVDPVHPRGRDGRIVHQTMESTRKFVQGSSSTNNSVRESGKLLTDQLKYNKHAEKNLKEGKSVSLQRPDFTKAGIKKAFRDIDLNGNGSLDMKELHTILAAFMHMTDKAVDEILSEFDHNGDGELNFHEFQQIFFPPQTPRCRATELCI